MFFNFTLLTYVLFFLLDFKRSLKYVHNSIVSTFRTEINRNNTVTLIFCQVFGIEKCCIFLVFSWIVVMIVLASSILILIFSLPVQLFLIDKAKKKVCEQNIFFLLACLLLILLINSDRRISLKMGLIF